MYKFETWTYVHIALAVLHFAAGIYVFAALGDGIRDTRQTVYWTSPTVYDDDENSFYVRLDNYWHVQKVSPIEIHGAVSLATAVSHLIAARIYSDEVDGVCPEGPNVLRWIEYAFTATAMTLSGYISVGQGDLYVLIVVTVLGMLLQWCGYLMEKNKGNPALWTYFQIGCFVEFVIALPLNAWTLSLSVYDNVGLYVVLAAYIIYYLLFPLNAVYDATKETDFKKTDKRYAVLSFTSKMALFWITVGALMSNVSNGTEKKQWDNVIVAACVVPAAIVVGYMSISLKGASGILEKRSRISEKIDKGAFISTYSKLTF